MVALHRLGLILILILCAAAQGGQPPLSAQFALPDMPRAGVVGTEAVILNPAALYVNKPMGLHFYHSFAEGDLSGDNAFAISTSGVGFAYQRFGLGFPEAVSRYDFAIASRISRDLSAGLSYTYYKTDWDDLDKAHSWNYSLLWHADRSLALSVQLENLNRNHFAGEESAIGYLLSAALRPLQERLTIGADVKMYGGQQLSDADWRISGHAYLKPGLAVYAGIGTEQRFGVGFQVDFGQSSVGGESFFDSEGDYERSTVFVQVNASERDRFIRGPGKILHVDLSGEIPEEQRRSLFHWKGRESVYRKLSKIREARNDPEIRGLLLTLNRPAIGWGKLSDFRAEIAAFAAAGKPVVCYLGLSPGTGSYFLASVADSVLMVPVDALYLTGLRAEISFYAGALDKLGIEAEIEKTGEYKNAPNKYTESSLTPEHREAVETLLDDIYREVLEQIASSRAVPVADLEKLIDSGPFTSIQAESLGLIDGRLYPGELESRLPALFGGNDGVVAVTDYRDAPRFRRRFGETPLVAVVAVEGEIARGRSGSHLLFGKRAGSASIAASVRRAADDSSVKSIVMRLDTPGGDALASDLVWGEITRARESKPVIVSMSDVCASGGYYMATASDRIVLEPCTVTGSIGVYAGKADLSGFYEKLGVTTEIIERGEHAAMFSLQESFADDERAILRRQINDLYRNFLTVVAESRGLTVDSVDAIARGRVWSGRKALELGLADQEGTLLSAVDLAASLAGLDDQEYEVVELPSRRVSFNLPSLALLGISDLLTAAGLESNPFDLFTAGLESSQPQYRLPFSLRIE